MPDIQTVQLRSLASGRAPIAGLQTHNIDTIKYGFADILTLLGTTGIYEVFLEAAAFGDNSAPITEINAVDQSTWTMDNSVSDRETSPSVMRGAYRWYFQNQTAEGFRGTVSSNADTWDGITIWVPDFELVSGVNSAIFDIGSGADRTQLIVSSAGLVRFYNGTVDPSIDGTGANLSTGTRYTIMVTYNESDHAVKIYINSATPVATGTITDGLCPESTAAVGGSYDDAVDGDCKFSSILVLNRAVTADEATELMAIGQTIRTAA